MTSQQTPAQLEQQGNRNPNGSGQYAEDAHAHPGTDVIEVAAGQTLAEAVYLKGRRDWGARCIDSMVNRGELSPAARDMDPREVLDQHAEANAMNLREKRELLARAGMNLQMLPAEFVPGDRVDLEDVARENGDCEVDCWSVHMAMTGMATIETVEDEGRATVWLYTDQGAQAVDRNRLLNMNLGDGRCSNCGTPNSRWGNLCPERCS